MDDYLSVKSISLSCWKPENEFTKFKVKFHLCTLINKSKSNFKTKPQCSVARTKIEGNLNINSPTFSKINECKRIFITKPVHYLSFA